MVHLPPDSRLLVSLVKQEQAYAAQLHSLLNTSGTSLSALATYASSSPPTISPTLNGVASALSGADEALRMYGESLNDWIHQLGNIKQKEEEVLNVGRDREILVTRLLKVSHKSKSPPPSLLHSAPDSSSSTSFSTFNSKINNAQAELQACESLLAEKEQELEQVRIRAIGQGLKVRCSALIQCGWAWGEMGKRGLEMLDRLDGTPTLSNGHVAEFFKPLPDPARDHDHDSLISSLSPSQSASQIGAGALPPLSALPVSEKSYKLDIPPPHLMSDHSVIPRSSALDGDSSSDDEGPVEVHENPRFHNSRRSKGSTWTAPSTPARHSPVPFPASKSDLGPPNKLKHREKKRTSLLGNIAALFRTSMSPKAQHDDAWNSRTDRNIISMKTAVETDMEHSSGEEDAQTRSVRSRRRKFRSSLTAIDNRKLSRGRDDTVQPYLPMEPTTAPPKNINGKLGRSSSVRSTVSEPARPLRLRANTVSSVPSELAIPNGSARNYGRTTSMDGRGSHTGTDTDTTVTWKPSKTKGDSLMRIVEGSSTDDPSSRLEVVRAPGSAIPRLPLLINPPPPLPASLPSSPTTSKVGAYKRTSMPATTTIPGLLVSPPRAPEKKPLRSAMRNTNRSRSLSPSPSASPNVPPAQVEDQSPSIAPLSLPGPSLSMNSRRIALSQWEIPSTILESPRQSTIETADPHRHSQVTTRTDDSASISSYETGREDLDDEDATEAGAAPAPEQALPPPPPPISEKLSPSQDPVFTTGTGTADRHDLASATSDESAAPARRKSVRLSSLPPQVSATPPALDEYQDADRAPWGPSHELPHPRKHAESSTGWSTRITVQDTAWDDSASEDETYQAAKKALNRAHRHTEKEGRR